jgi:hypothetical protein
MSKILTFRDKQKIEKTLDLIIQNLDILNRNHKAIKYLNYTTTISILASDYNFWEQEIKAFLMEKIEDPTEEKINNMFDILVGDMEQFKDGGAWFYHYVYFDADTNKFNILDDIVKSLYGKYTYKIKEDKLFAVLSDLKDLIL